MKNTLIGIGLLILSLGFAAPKLIKDKKINKEETEKKANEDYERWLGI